MGIVNRKKLKINVNVNLISSHSFLRRSIIEKIALNKHIPPKFLGERGFVQPVNGVMKSSTRNIRRIENMKVTIALATSAIFVIFLISVIFLTSYFVIYFIGISYSEKKKSNFNKLKYNIKIDFSVKEY
jgi:hypothetical protein